MLSPLEASSNTVFMIKINFNPEEIFSLAMFLEPWKDFFKKNMKNNNKQQIRPFLNACDKIIKEASIGKEVIKEINENIKKSKLRYDNDEKSDK